MASRVATSTSPPRVADVWSIDDENGDDPGPLEPRSRAERARLGSLLLAAGLPAEAARVLEPVAGIGCEDPGLLRIFAVARFRSGDIDGGVTAARRVLRFDPTCVVSMHNLALTALQAGQIQVAGGWVSRGLRIERNDDDLRRLRARVWVAWARERVGGGLRRVGLGRDRA